MSRALSGALLVTICAFGAQAQTPPAAAAPPQSPELAEATRLSAEVVRLYNQQQYDEALPPARRALELREGALGKEHPLVGDALRNLAAVQSARKNYDESLSLYRRALKVFEKAYGKDDIKLAVTLDDMGWLYFALSNAGEAEAVFLRALAIREKALGADSDEVAQSAYRLGRLYERLRRHAKAVEYYKRAVAIKEKASSPNEELADYMEKCACAMIENGQKEEAERMQDRVFMIRRLTRVPTPETLNSGILQGKAILRVEPRYPEEARRQRVYGSVLVRVTVDECGIVRDARAVKGEPALVDAAVAAARQWRFTPTKVNGTPIKVMGTITFNFYF
jgi:TonB family protein